MHVVLFANLYFPDFAGGGALYTDLATELVRRGHRVEVLTSYSYFPEWKDKSGRNGWRIAKERIDGVEVRRHGMRIPTVTTSTKQRALYEGSFAVSLSRSLWRARRADVALAFSTMLAPVGAGAVLRTLFRVPLAVSVQDIASSGAAAAHIVGGRTSRFIRSIERATLRRADLLTSLTPEMVATVQTIVGDGRTVELVPNWVHGSVADTVASLPSKIGRPAADPIRLLYSGNIGNKQGLEDFCERLSATPLSFHMKIFGAGPGARRLHEWHDAHGDPRFEFGPLKDERDFVAEVHEADLFVITEREHSGTSYMPSKLLPPITSGTPVLAVCDVESSLGAEMLRSRVGPHATWDQLDELLERLPELVHDVGQLRRWQQACITRSEAFGRRSTIDTIERHLEWLATR